MKAADTLASRLAGNMMESMGAASAGVPVPSPAGVLHGGAAKFQGAARLKDALSIKLEQIVADPNQPRKEFDPDDLADLAASLKARGQLQPIRVRWDEGAGRWMVIAGERRFRAAQLAGLPSLVCIEATRPQSEDEILEDQLVENCVRADLKPVEQARAFRTLMDRRGWSYRQLGAALNLSSAHITRSMALLTLPVDLQEQVDSGVVPASAAAEVAKIEDDGARREIAGRIAAGEMTRDEAVREVRQATARAPRSGPGKGRGGAARPAKPRTFRTLAGKVVVEPKKGAGPGSIRAALEEALSQLTAQDGGRAEVA